MADPKRVDAGNGIGNIAELLGLLGGQKGTTTVQGDTGALNSVIGQIQATDPAALLQSIFSQAGGQIPGLTAARSNAVGARTGGNSVSGTAVDKLLQDTVLKAQQQLMSQKLQQQALQVQAGTAIAGANKTQQTQQGTNLGKAGTILGALSAGQKLLGSPLGQQVVQKGKGLFDQLTGGGGTGAADLSSSAATDFGSNFAPVSYENSFDSSAIDPTSWGDVGSLFGGGLSDLGSGFSDVSFDSTDLTPPDPSDLFGFANGGLVGRDEKQSARAQPTKRTQAQAKQKAAPQMMMPQMAGYANGGVVKSGGGRRSSAPTYNPLAPTPSSAVQSPGDVLNPQRMQQQLMGELNPGSGVANNDGQGNVGLTLGNVAATLGMAGLMATNPAMAVAAMMDNMVNEQATNTGVASPVGTHGFAGLMGLATANPVGIAKGLMGLMGGESTGTAASDGGFSMGIGDGVGAENGGFGTGFGIGVGNGMGEGFGADSGVGDGPSSSTGDNGDNGDSGDSGDGGEGGYASGGKVTGPGTGTSDSIQAQLSTGEYVIPADVVQKLGVSFFDHLRDHFHSPAAPADWKMNAPEDSDSKNGVDDADE